MDDQKIKELRERARRLADDASTLADQVEQFFKESEKMIKNASCAGGFGYEMNAPREEAIADFNRRPAPADGLVEAVVEAAIACFDRERPGVLYRAFVEILRARVNEYLDSRNAALTKEPTK